MRDIHEYVTRTGRFANLNRDVLNADVSAKDIINDIRDKSATPTQVQEYLQSTILNADKITNPQERNEKMKQLKLVTAFYLTGGFDELLNKDLSRTKHSRDMNLFNIAFTNLYQKLNELTSMQLEDFLRKYSGQVPNVFQRRAETGVDTGVDADVDTGVEIEAGVETDAGAVQPLGLPDLYYQTEEEGRKKLAEFYGQYMQQTKKPRKPRTSRRATLSADAEKLLHDVGLESEVGPSSVLLILRQEQQEQM